MGKAEEMAQKTQRHLHELNMLVNTWKMCDYSNAFYSHLEISDQVALHKIINTLEKRVNDIQEKVNAI